MQTNTKKIFTDGLVRFDNRVKEFDLPLARFVARRKKTSVFFSRSGRMDSFFTDDSKLYLTPEELKRKRRGERIVRIISRLDSLNSKVFSARGGSAFGGEKTKTYPMQVTENVLARELKKIYANFRVKALGLVQDSRQRLTVAKVWNLSIVGAVIFGMFVMTMIYKYLGQGVSAAIQENTQQAQVASQPAFPTDPMASEKEQINANIDVDSITSLLAEQNSQQEFEKQMADMVKGYPIEKMVPLIAKKDRTVAAFMIGIAKQESSWGLHVPVYGDQDCYNLWGYRGKNPVGTGGHTCFDSPQDAVDTVAKRIEFLVSNQKLNTPNKMIIWKCGDCSWDNQTDMQTWINTVSIYFQKLNTEQ